MFHMLTKNDRRYIDMLLDRRFERFSVEFDKKFDEKLGEFAIMIQNGFAECVSKVEFNEVKEDISDIKKDVGELKNNIAELRYEVYRKKDD